MYSRPAPVSSVQSSNLQSGPLRSVSIRTVKRAGLPVSASLLPALDDESQLVAFLHIGVVHTLLAEVELQFLCVVVVGDGRTGPGGQSRVSREVRNRRLHPWRLNRPPLREAFGTSRWSSRVCRLTVAVDEFAPNSTLVGSTGGASRKSAAGEAVVIVDDDPVLFRGDAVSPVRVSVNVAASPSCHACRAARDADAGHGGQAGRVW